MGNNATFNYFGTFFYKNKLFVSVYRPMYLMYPLYAELFNKSFLLRPATEEDFRSFT